MARPKVYFNNLTDNDRICIDKTIRELSVSDYCKYKRVDTLDGRTADATDNDAISRGRGNLATGQYGQSNV